MNMEDKRKRTVNFTSDEKSLLTELVLKYKDVIENKKSDATTNAEKLGGWKRLSDEFNALSCHCKRYPESLKTCWENIKRQTKKQSASRKRELFMTGGGRPPPPPPSTGADGIIETILGPALDGLQNIYDGDALLDTKGKEEIDMDTQSTSDDYTQISSNTEFLNSENEILQIIEVENEPSCSFTTPKSAAGTSSEKKHVADNLNWDKEKNLKWEGWTPKSLKMPISEVLKPVCSQENKENSWLKRRRPDKQSLSDQLIQEKINLVKTLIENSKEESSRRILILEEQLKQEKIKTQKLL